MVIVRWLAAVAIFASSVWPANAQTATVELSLDFARNLGPLNVKRIALGQGGLSPDPMWHSRVAEIRALHPAIVRIFIQTYFDLLAADGHYHFEALDQSVDDIVRTGATPLLNIDFKPRARQSTRESSIRATTGTGNRSSLRW